MLDSEPHAELVGEVGAVAAGSDEVPVELKQRRILETRLELVHVGGDSILHMRQDLMEEGLEGVGGLVDTLATDAEHDRVEPATREEHRKPWPCNDELIEVVVTDTTPRPRNGLVTGLKRGEYTESLDRLVVIVGEVGATHDGTGERRGRGNENQTPGVHNKPHPTPYP